MTIPVTALSVASFRHLEIDTALRSTFDWWAESQMRDMDIGDSKDLEQFIHMFWTIMDSWYLGGVEESPHDR